MAGCAKKNGRGDAGSVDFGQIYASLIAATGWTWDYIEDHIDLPRYDALMLYYSKNPPVHVMLAGFFGCGPKKSEAIEKASEFVPVGNVSADKMTELLKGFGIGDE